MDVLGHTPQHHLHHDSNNNNINKLPLLSVDLCYP